MTICFVFISVYPFYYNFFFYVIGCTERGYVLSGRFEPEVTFVVCNPSKSQMKVTCSTILEVCALTTTLLTLIEPSFAAPGRFEPLSLIKVLPQLYSETSLDILPCEVQAYKICIVSVSEQTGTFYGLYCPNTSLPVWAYINFV